MSERFVGAAESPLSLSDRSTVFHGPVETEFAGQGEVRKEWQPQVHQET